MKPFYLSEITTTDGLVHQGIFFSPKNPGKRAILWVHGLTGRFYGDKEMMESFAEACEGLGWGFAAFNNRGHDHITGMHKVDEKNPSGFTYAMGGGGYETFEECVFDIHAGVDFLVSHGFFEVFVIGHSTGALKLIYSEGIKPHTHVSGIILAGALSDRLGPDVDKKNVLIQLSRMEKRIKEGKGDELVFGLSFFPMTPKRYVSLYSKDSAEEATVDYDGEQPNMRAFSNIQKPVLVIFSGRDENLDRPAADIKKVFDAMTQSKKYRSIIIPGVDHGFSGKEKEAVSIIVDWIKAV